MTEACTQVKDMNVGERLTKMRVFVKTVTDSKDAKSLNDKEDLMEDGDDDVKDGNATKQKAKVKE